MNTIKMASLVGLVCVTLGCSSMGQKEGRGTAIGAAAGAALGAIAGNQSGNAAQGAAIGAALGGLAGNQVGKRMDRQAKELARVAETERTEKGIITKLKGDILFDSGKADLKPAAVKNINELSDILKKYPENQIVVAGHTDNLGNATLNKTLSEQRAKAVRDQMIERGVPQKAVEIVGMGPTKPVAENKTAEGRSKNRRVELTITADEAEVAAR